MKQLKTYKVEIAKMRFQFHNYVIYCISGFYLLINVKQV